MTGEVGILNVGCGDTKLSFDPSNPQECIRAARIVKDMLRRGYALLVATGEREGKPLYQRVYAFDDTKYEYVIADFDPEIAAQEDQKEAENVNPERTVTGRKSRTKRVSAAKHRAVAVPRSAGG
jgi:hypothetical protein